MQRRVQNIAEGFVESAQKHASKTALIEAKSGVSIDFAALNERSDLYARFFSENGIQVKEPVMLMVRPSIDFICLTLALFKIGSPVILIDPGMGLRNVLRSIRRVQPRYLIGIPKAILFSKLFPSAFASLKKTFCYGRSFGVLGKDISRIQKKDNSRYPLYIPEDDDIAAIVFTTGSTGPPKGVRYDHSVLYAQLQLIQGYYQINAEDIDQPAFPLFALFSTALGACAVIPDLDPARPAKVDPVKFIESLQKYKVTYSFGSPAIWRVVSAYCVEAGVVLPALDKVLMAGAPVSYTILQSMRQILSSEAKVYTPYGATEGLPVCSIDYREILDETTAISRRGGGTCVGRALPGVDVRIIAPSDEVLFDIAQCRFLETGQVGEIIVKGGVVTKAYINDTEETLMAKIQDQSGFWHRMGDLGYIDDKKRLWFCGRKAHRVISEEQVFFPIPCEAIVNESKDVFRSALVGVKNYDNKTEPALILETESSFSGDQGLLIREIAALAAKNELTKDIRSFLIHPAFPVDIRHNAKIFREKLSVWAQKKLYP